MYGVVVADGEVDEAATAANATGSAPREGAPGLVGETRGSVDLAGARRLDDNLVELDGHGVVGCAHCGQVLGEAERLGVARYEGPPSTPARRSSDRGHYVDAPWCSGSTAAPAAGRRCTPRLCPPTTATRSLRAERAQAVSIRPICRAVATAREREGSWSLRSTADTWCATVFSDRTKRPAICALERPSESA